MPKKFPSPLILGLGAAAVLCLGLGLYLHQWILGLGGAVAALCLIALAEPVRRHFRPGDKEAATAAASAEEAVPRRPAPVAAPLPEIEETPGGTLVDQMLAQGRYPLLLRPQIAGNLSPHDLRRAHEALDAWMCLSPPGAVLIRSHRFEEMNEDDRLRAEKRIEVDAFYLDRYCVTNRQYKRFVDAGGYEQLALWDEAVWPAMLQFVDSTGQAGPRYWANGTYPAGRENHPVVGVCWYEACAYARWVGKRLPSDAEWIKAAAWPVTAENGKILQRKYPWGDAMDRNAVNLWGTGPAETVPVSCYPHGASVGGALQLIGNVWEWTSTNFGVWDPPTLRLETEMPLKSLRGGAFDTYFDAQATSFFQSGDNPLVRRHNIGFRCAIGVCDIFNPEEAEGVWYRAEHDAEGSAAAPGAEFPAAAASQRDTDADLKPQARISELEIHDEEVLS
jgi:iron(II)-dependent oxidoreductase